MKKAHDQNLQDKLNNQREEINKLLEIDPEILREVHGGAAAPCDCCKWEPNVA